jgi:hypothetical protein
LLLGRLATLPGQATRAMMEEGPYRLSRNPLYVGLLAIGPEERFLHERFGAPYDDYTRRVRVAGCDGPAGRRLPTEFGGFHIRPHGMTPELGRRRKLTDTERHTSRAATDGRRRSHRPSQGGGVMHGWLLWGLILPVLLVWAGVVQWRRNNRR